MSEENVQHAVSHKLYLERSGDSLHVVITDKNHHIVDSVQFPAKNADELHGLLSSEEKLQSIYSSVVLVNSGNRFVTIPQSITETKDKQEIFSLSYPVRSGYSMVEDHIGIQLMVYYEMDKAYLDVLRSSFPKLNLNHELTVIHNAILPRLSDDVNNIVAHVSGKSLLILAFSQGKLIFGNHFELNGDDDIFYFVMLSIEQLEFDPEYTELILLNDAKEDQSDPMKDKFERFVHTISVPRDMFDEQSTNREWSTSVSFAIQAAIQCA